MDKRCSRCKRDKPVSEFHKNRAQPDGYANYCKVCASLVNQERVERDPKYYAKEYAKTSVEQRAAKKQYYHDHKAECNARTKAYYEAHKEEILEHERIRRAALPPKQKRRRGLHRLAARCGHSVDALEQFYSTKVVEQNGCCAICGISESELSTRLHIDHCPKTSVLRGLLCGNCNTGIGLLKHDQDLLDKAKVYLAVNVATAGVR